MSKYLVVAYILFGIGVALAAINTVMLNMHIQVIGSFINGLSGIALIYEQMRRK